MRSALVVASDLDRSTLQRLLRRGDRTRTSTARGRDGHPWAAGLLPPLPPACAEGSHPPRPAGPRGPGTVVRGRLRRRARPSRGQPAGPRPDALPPAPGSGRGTGSTPKPALRPERTTPTVTTAGQRADPTNARMAAWVWWPSAESRGRERRPSAPGLRRWVWTPGTPLKFPTRICR
jgi:hypothetical protein